MSNKLPKRNRNVSIYLFRHAETFTPSSVVFELHDNDDGNS